MLFSRNSRKVPKDAELDIKTVENIEAVEQIKYLGIIVDNKLSFRMRADYTCPKYL